MNRRSLLIAFWVFVVLCAIGLPIVFRKEIVTFVGSVFVRKEQSGQQVVNQSKLQFETFPKQNPVKTDLVEDNGLFYPVQGIIHDYGQTSGGINYLNLDYVVGNRVLYAKVLLRIDETAIPVYLSETGEADAASKKRFRDSYVDSIPAITWKKTETVPMNILDFKKAFPQHALVKINVLKTYPEKTLRTGSFCKIHGYFMCGVSDLADKYSGKLSDFWKGDGVPYEGYLVPLSFDTNAVMK